jgi:hypothetical protein
MKDETRSAAATSHGIEPKHQFEHAPTVIHDPEEDMTLLARWLKHGLEEGGKFWVGVAGVVVVVVVLAVLGSGILNTGGGEANSAWSELVVAQNPGQKLEVAEDHPNSKAATAARLQAASEFFLDAIRDLPNNKDAALPQLRKSLDLYQTVAREAAKDSPEAVAAAFGVARAHEAPTNFPKRSGSTTKSSRPGRTRMRPRTRNAWSSCSRIPRSSPSTRICTITSPPRPRCRQGQARASTCREAGFRSTTPT